MYNPHSDSYYDRLGIPEDASPEDVKAAYKALRKEMHPDTKPDVARAYYDDIMQRLNEAHDALSDPKRRSRHDADLRRAREEAETATSSGTHHEQPYSEPYSGEEEAEDVWEEWEEEPASYSPGPSHHDPGPSMPRIPAGLSRIGGLGIGGVLVLILVGSCAFAMIDGASSDPQPQANNKSQNSSGQQKKEQPKQKAATPEPEQAKEVTVAKTQLSEADRQAVTRAVRDYFDSFDYIGSDPYSYEAQIKATIVSPDWYESPAGKDAQDETRKLTRGDEMDQDLDLEKFSIEEEDANKVVGTATWEGHANLGRRDSGPMHRRNEVRLKKTDDGGWKVTYGGKAEDV